MRLLDIAVPRPIGRAGVLVILLACMALLPLIVRAASAPSGDPATVKAGEAIYRKGVLGSGETLVATRGTGVDMQGAAAACISCHQRSGLGSVEGRLNIPPVTARYLFHPRAPSNDEIDLPYVPTMRGDREAYTDETLARAIREGLDSDGKALHYLMPHYVLNDADMAALIGYLKSLDQRQVPGVTDTVLHFATIITPDTDPAKRRAVLDVIEKFFAERNSRQMVPVRGMHISNRTALANSMFMVHRQWQLHVWELTGSADTWQRQLEQHLAREPVFAVISGLGGTNWAPVHAFCESAKVPCLFPNVENPVASDHDFYSLYFSKGVLLEAELIANRILDSSTTEHPKTVHQIYRVGDNGEAAAHVLGASLKQHGITVSDHALAAGAPGDNIADALRKASTGDVLVLWLRPADVAALGDASAAPATVYMSGLMGGLDGSPLPPTWRERARVAYPFDLPDRRRVRVDFALGWFRIRNIPVVDEQLQADTYLACGLLSETLNHMVDTFVRDYLIERIQDDIEHRVVTGYYPRLTLATGQTFASKGGYIVRFAGNERPRLVADSNWLVP